MRRVVKLAEAAAHTGLTPWALRQGAISGKYPAMRTGGARGTILFDLDLLEESITRQMLANVKTDSGEQRGKIRPVSLNLVK